MNHLLFKIISLALLFLMGNISIAQKANRYTISQDIIDHYKIKNNKEIRLLAYKDDENALLNKLNQLQYINKSRRKYKVQELKLDILASRVANKIAIESATNNYMGHWNMKGEKPYQRYAFAGGNDHISENTYSISSSTTNLIKSEDNINYYMQSGHNAFMKEKVPNNGHKINCIDPNHNHIGIGYAIQGREFRYYEEFIDRYLTFSNFTKENRKGESIIIPVKPPKDKYLYMAIVYHEPPIKPMSPKAISEKEFYLDYSKKISHKITPWEIPKPNESGYHLLSFKFDEKGVYYIHIYINNQPYTSGKATTKNKIQASGIVVSVN